MKKQLLWAVGCAIMTCCNISCENSEPFINEQYNEQEIKRVTFEYEECTKDSPETEDEDTIKIETQASEKIIQSLMVEYDKKVKYNPEATKEKLTRATTYATAPTTLVGVFKHGSCGNYKELYIRMDAEDDDEASKVTGDIGDTHVDHNGNVIFAFCLTEAHRYYPGGVFLINHISYNSNSSKSMKVVVRHHDTEDNENANAVIPDSNGNIAYTEEELSSGYTQINTNMTMAWAFPNRTGSDLVSNGFGPASSIIYGVLAPGNATTGELYIDDEDDDNKNWAKLYIGRTFDKDLTPRMNCFSPYGMTLGINTNYSLTFSNTSEFKSKNIYYSIY